MARQKALPARHDVADVSVIECRPARRGRGVRAPSDGVGGRSFSSIPRRRHGPASAFATLGGAL